MPALGQPQIGLLVTPIGDEIHPFARGDKAIGERIGPQQHVVARALVVECEAGAVVANRVHTARELYPALLGWSTRDPTLRLILRIGRVDAQYVFDVH